ncbi:MAG: glutaminase [Rhodothermales bacterium]|nr:glutaminase [Rhodothermales bacterium]
MSDLNSTLSNIRQEIMPVLGTGRVADYIAPLASVSTDHFGMSIRTVDGRTAAAGDSDVQFSVQSIAKVLSLTLAMDLAGDEIWKRVGREPSGTRFNSLVQLESENGIPRNPMINAGALVILDIIISHQKEGADLLSRFIESISPSGQARYDAVVCEAERQTAYRNRALANYLKSFGNLENDPDEVVDLHCKLSSLSMTCDELCAAFVYLATGGFSLSGKVVTSPRQVKRINAVMLTCGVYDEAGDYAYRVGLPAKSGVGGGIIAVMPGQFVTTVWSPALNKSGNSYCGTRALELLTTKLGTSLF